MSIIKYLRNVHRESKNIQWPTKKVTTLFTVGVIIVSLITIVYIGVLDFAFVEAVNKFLLK